MNTGITYSQGFLEWEAAQLAGLSLWEWDSGVYPNTFKAKVIAWYRNHKEVETHVQDKVNRAKKK